VTRRVEDEMVRERSLGMRAKRCIHPRGRGPVKPGIGPGEAEVVWGREPIDEFDRARAEGLAALGMRDEIDDLQIVERGVLEEA
jgi:citrate lyase beta subunit